MAKKLEIESKKQIFECPYRKIDEKIYMREDGVRETMYIVNEHDIAIVMGITKDNKVLLIQEYFFAEDRRVKTLVGGLVENDDPKKTAEAELLEEAGCVAREIIDLGSAMVGKYITGSIHCFLALGIEKKFEQTLEESEDIDMDFISMEEFKNILLNSELHGVGDVMCAYQALHYLKEL
ncbi:NUDIX hydrolase [Patescibacteria group bacterium]|nr:NUDIX hydrolase [Patescibacteria group bacterium]MBU1895670.1 NUDIX hydrolase [Patescibacteria group bacterium]